MPETLVIRLPDNPSAPAEWVVVDADGGLRLAATEGELESALPAAEGRRVVALVGAAQVLRTAVTIPLRNPAKIRQALPFALEEQLAGDVEGQHFACARRDADGLVEVAVADRELVDGWRAACEAAGLRLDGLYAESDAVAAVPNTLTVWLGPEQAIVRDAAGMITVADHDALQATLDLLLAQDEAPPAGVQGSVAEPDSADVVDTDPTAAGELDQPDDEPLDNEQVDELAATVTEGPVNLLVYAHPAVHERHAMLWEMLRLRVASLDVRLLEDRGLGRLAAELINTGGVNLLQGAYAPKTEIAIHWPQWRVAALLLAGFTALFLLRQGIELWQLSSEEQRLDTAAEQLLLASFSDAAATDDPWPELRRRLGVIEAEEQVLLGPGFAEGIAAVANAFTGTPDLEMEALSYRDGKLDLQLLAPNVASLDQLRRKIAEPGEFAAEIQSANPDDEKIKGRLKIEAAGGA